MPLARERAVSGGAKVAEWIRTLAYRLHAMMRAWLDVGLVRRDGDPIATVASLRLLSITPRQYGAACEIKGGRRWRQGSRMDQNPCLPPARDDESLAGYRVGACQVEAVS